MKRLAKKLPWLAGFMMMAATLFLAHPVMAASKAPAVDSVKYESSKKIEVEFKGDVHYKNPSIKVTDSKGKAYTATILEADDDDFTFRIASPKKGMTYTYKISNVAKAGSNNFTTVKGTFRIAGKTEVLVEDVDYDREDKEVTFEFQGNVKWKNAKVVIKDSTGKNFVQRIKEKDNDEIEVKVKGLTKGKKYTYKITGVARKGSKKFKTVKGTFKP